MTKTLVAFALAFVASTASAAISGSAHDFINNGYMTTPPATTCTFCHVPHGGSTTVAGLPLWNTNRSLTVPTALYGTNATVDSKGTMTCLGCHATGAATDMGTDNSMPANGPTSQLIVGTDLSNDHPVGDATIITLGLNGLNATITLGGVAIADGTVVQCSTCHDVHNTTGAVQVGSKLLRSYATDFCLACHNK